MLNARKYSASTFLSLEDLSNGPRTETIENVAVGNYDKLVATFRSGAKLSLNKTNVKTLIAAFGDDADKWVGNDVKLSAGKTDYQGENVDTILVEPSQDIPF
jgi:hypothetical protein